MKAFAALLIVLVLVAVGGLGYLYLTANIEVSATRCIATDGVTQAELLEQLKDSVEAGTFVGTRFSEGAIGPADQYQFLTYTVSLKNNAFLTAEVIELRLTPMSGDVLLLTDSAEHSLAGGQETDLAVTLLTERNMHSVREGTVTYYLWGIPFSTRLTLGD